MDKESSVDEKSLDEQGLIRSCAGFVRVRLLDLGDLPLSRSRRQVLALLLDCAFQVRLARDVIAIEN